MKRTVSLILLFAIILSSFSFASASGEYIVGDVDGDGIVSMKDSAIIARNVAGWKDYKKPDGSITFPEDLSKPFPGRSLNGFCVGYRRVVITPDLDGIVPLGGYGNSYNRLAGGKYDDNCATCVAFMDTTGEIFIMVSIDILNILNSTATQMRNAISAKTGVPFDHINICCTHTHNGPDTHAGYVGTINSVDKYLIKTYKQIANAALYAIRDLDRADFYYGMTETKDISFVRRYKVNYSSSSLQGATKGWGSISSSGIASYYGYETAPDESVQYLYIKRVNEKPILLYNWQCHPAITGSINKCTADFINASRNKLENDLDVLSVYYQGACGNINTRNPVYWGSSHYDNIGTSYDNSQYIGNELAKTIETHFKAKKYEQVATGKIQVDSGSYFCNYYDNSEEIAAAVAYQKKKGKTVTEQQAEAELLRLSTVITDAYISNGYSMSSTAIQNKVKELYNYCGVPLSSYYSINAIKQRYNRVHNSDGTRKVNAGADIRYSIFTIGDQIAFAFTSYEMFDTDAMDIKWGYHFTDNKTSQADNNIGVKSTQSNNYSKFPHTFVVELTNDSQGYIPSDYAWDHKGYEVETSYYGKGTGSLIAGKIITMLNEAYSTATAR